MTGIPEGARIICPNKNCRVPLFEFVKQLDMGESLSLDALHPLRPDALKSAETGSCPACGALYYDNGAVSLHFGWFPYRP